MKFVTLVTALAAVVPAALAANLTINTPPSVVECEPTQFSWENGVPPYYLTLVPAGQITATPIKQFPAQNATSFTWVVDLLSGTSFTTALKDSTGATAYSDIITIQAGTSSSCVNNTVSETGTSGSSPAATTASGSSGAATTKGSSGSSSSATGTASASASTPSSAAGRLGVSSALGVAGVMGLVGAALF